MRAGVSLLACATLAACSNIAPLPAGVCGNGVVDPQTEDCDSVAPGDPQGCGKPSDPVLACRLLCDTDSDCPAGWACAPDGGCVHGTASFVQGPVTSAALDTWTLGDVDGDGKLDIAGMDGDRLQAFYGDTSGSFVASPARFVDRDGKVWFGDADGSGGSAFVAAVPTQAGVVVLTGDPTRSSGFQPLSYTPIGFRDATSTLKEEWFIPVGMPPGYRRNNSVPWSKEGDGLLALHLAGGGLRAATYPIPVLYPSSDTQVDAPLSPNGVSYKGLGERAVRIDPPSTAGPDLGSSVLIAPPQAEHALVLSVSVPSAELPFDPGVSDVKVLKLPNTLRVADNLSAATRGVPLASAPDANGEVTLFVPAEDAATQQTRLVRFVRDQDGSVGSPTVDSRFHSLSASKCSGLPLAMRDLDGDGQPDFVMPRGLCHDVGGTLEPVADLDADWSQAVIADLNGDGTPDVAAVRSDRQCIDVLYLDGKSGHAYLDGRFGYAPFPLDHLPQQPQFLRAAQLDGLGGWDLVFAENTNGDHYTVDVSFGTEMGMTTPEPVSSVKDLDRIEAGRFRDNLGAYDDTSDLVLTVGNGSPDSQFGLVAMYGSAQRAIYAPLVLANEGEADRPVSASIGKSAQGKAWMATVAQQASGKSSRLDTVPDVLAQQEADFIPSLSSSDYTCGSGSSLQSAFAWTMVDLDGDGTDEAVGVDGADGCKAQGTTTNVIALHWDGSVSDDTLDLPVAPSPIHELTAADLDRDGLPDLVLARKDGLIIAWGDAKGWSAATRVPLHGLVPLSVALVDADERPGKEIAVGTARGVQLIAFNGRNATIGDPFGPAPAQKVRAGDVNGDHVDDLAVSNGQSIQVLFGKPNRTVGVLGQ